MQQAEVTAIQDQDGYNWGYLILFIACNFEIIFYITRDVTEGIHIVNPKNFGLKALLSLLLSLEWKSGWLSSVRVRLD